MNTKKSPTMSVEKARLVIERLKKVSNPNKYQKEERRIASEVLERHASTRDRILFGSAALAAIIAGSAAGYATRQQPQPTPAHVASANPQPSSAPDASTPDSAVNTQEQEKISKLKAELEKTYSVEIVIDALDNDYLRALYDDDRQVTPKAELKPLHLEDYSPLTIRHKFSALRYLQDRLGMYPVEMIRQYGPKKIHLIQSGLFIRNLDHYSFRDTVRPNGDNILLTFDSDGDKNDDNAAHELFHDFDMHSKGGWTRDRKIWLKHSHLLPNEPYPDNVRKDACFNGKGMLEEKFRTVEGCRELFRHELSGYLHTYGLMFQAADQRGEQDFHVENKATTGSILVTQDNKDALGIHWFAERAAEDEIIRAKLKILSGCDFELKKDTNGRPDITFTRLLTLDEYRQLTGNSEANFDYYRAWSTNKQGAVRMDPQYYNDLYSGKKINSQYWALRQQQ